MTADQISQINLLKTLTRNLLNSARAGDWEAATVLEADRRPLLYRVFGEVAPGSHVQHQALLHEILDADREIMHLAQQQREEVGGLLRQVGQGRSALKAYESNSR